MEYVRFGSSGLLVSKLCIGSWFLPRSKEVDEYGVHKVDVNEVRRIIKYAFDHGINFIDTANRYHGAVSPVPLTHVGNAECVLGEVLKEYDRESFVIVTKVGGRMASWPNAEGLSRKHIMWQVKDSLKRLQMDYVDVYLAHIYDPNTPLLETLMAFDDLVRQGKVHYIGSSNHPPEKIIEAMELAREYRLHSYITIQEPYSLLNREIEKTKIPIARRYSLAIMAYSPLAQGLLTEKYLKGIPELSRATISKKLKSIISLKRYYEMLKELKEIAKEKDATIAQLAIAWVLHKQKELGVTIVPIVSVSKLEHLEENLGALEIKLTDDDVKRIEEVVEKYGVKW